VKVPFQSVLQSVPPLASGDRLNRYEFERRYALTREDQKAELIEGIVYMAAALRFKSHGKPHGYLTGWLWTYMVATAGTELAVEPTIRLDLDNEPQPDAVLLISEESGGATRLSQDDYLEGAPELAVEIAASSVAIDLGDKLRAYRRNGIQEYLVWRVFEGAIDWFSLQAGEYVPIPVDEDGIVRSQVFPGLWLAVEAMLTGEMTTVLAIVNQGATSEAHQAFVEKLRSGTADH
jgi:Uma2 family endonuclease